MKKTFKLQRSIGTTAEHCCVPQCQASSKYNNVLSFHTFPKDEELSRKWVVAIRRDDFVITPHTWVCSRHFKVDDVREPTSEKGRRLLKKGAIPTLFQWNNFSLPPVRASVWERRERPLPQEDDAPGQDGEVEDMEQDSGPDVSSAAEVIALREEVGKLKEQIESLTMNRFGIHRFAASDKDIRFFTR